MRVAPPLPDSPYLPDGSKAVKLEKMTLISRRFQRDRERGRRRCDRQWHSCRVRFSSAGPSASGDDGRSHRRPEPRWQRNGARAWLRDCFAGI